MIFNINNTYFYRKTSTCFFIQTVGITRADRWGSRGWTGGITRADRCIAESASKEILRKRTFKKTCFFNKKKCLRNLDAGLRLTETRIVQQV